MRQLILLCLLLIGHGGGSRIVQFVEHPEDVVSLPGDSVFFSCESNTTRKIWWLHNRTILLNPSGSDHGLKMSDSGGSLSFRLGQHASEWTQQVGEYQCVTEQTPEDEATRNRYFVLSRPANLSVAHLLDFKVERNKTIETFEGNDVVIPCRLPWSLPPAFVQFFHDNLPINASNAQIINGDMLLIANVDADANAGVYTCSATNHITNQVKTSYQSYLLHVSSLPTSATAKPKLIHRPEENYDLMEGDTLRIPCIANGSPKPDIVWTRMSDNAPLQVDHGCMTIRNAQKSDSGDYMCAIFNGSRRFLRRTSVRVLYAPQVKITKRGTSTTLREFDSLLLDCESDGVPEAEVRWTVNGWPVLEESHNINRLSRRFVFPNGTLYISEVKRAVDEGVYQCFASNSAGRDEERIDVRVLGDDDDHEAEEDEDIWESREGGLLDQITTIPPSKPNVTQVSETSALLSWSVPVPIDLTQDFALDPMPIEFFKVQFREISGRNRSDWRTMDEIINARSRTFEVMGLKVGVKYRFRIVAVYANDDNRSSQLTRKFKLSRHFSPSDGKRREKETPPRVAPTITEILPLRQGSLRVGWKLNVSVKNVEGYFIYIRKSAAEKFRKITIIGHTSHSYIFEGLESGTEYQVQVQAFNFAGKSPLSVIRSQTTLQSANEDLNLTTQLPGKNESSALDQDEDVEEDHEGRVVLYLTVAGVLVLCLLVLLTVCSMIGCIQRKRAARSFSGANVVIHEKYLDTAKEISLCQRRQEQRLKPSTSLSNTAETTFSDARIYSSNSFIDHSRQFQGSHRLSSSSLTRFEEYTDEPSSETWKRRRKRECDNNTQT